MKNKRVLRATAVLLGMVTLLTGVVFGLKSSVNIDDDPIALGGTEVSEDFLVHQTEDDVRIIPDKYNTGAKGTLINVELGGMVGDIQLVAGSGGTKNVFDFYYRNKNIEGTVTLENYDFSKYPLVLYKADKVEKNINFVFNNCKFSMVSVGNKSASISYAFNNCTIENFYGSNAKFSKCKIGGSYYDGINPFQNVEVTDCFISDFGSTKDTGKEIHSDGTQIYGAADAEVKNISFDNCRFEIPPVASAGSNAYVNSCIMLSLEYSNAKAVQFSNCILNGGGYTIYTCAKKDNFKLEDINLSNLRVGCAKKYGTIYYKISPGVTYDTVEDTEALYVASVWKENGNTHFSVSNDTNKERTLKIITKSGAYDYTIPACKNGNDMSEEDTYAEMPFDVDITIAEDAEYAICYDTTIEGCAKQIRFMNWGDAKVYLTKEQFSTLFSGAEDVLYSGQCGKNVEYELNKKGELTLEGTGDTYSYSSGKPAPWTNYSDLVKDVKVEEGIEGLGQQLFRNCTAIKKVSLPDSLAKIETRTFFGCTGLRTITLPAALESLGDYSLPYETLTSVYYDGLQWDKVYVSAKNEGLNDKLYLNETNEETDILENGKCGTDATYTLSKSGVLKITGIGETYNYNTGKPAPWYDNRELIVKVEISERITGIGEQLFRKCSNISEIDLPNGIVKIGKNAFISCSNLRSIIIPGSVEEIQTRAFDATALESVKYQGTKEQWDKIVIGNFNTRLVENISFTE